MSVYEGGISKIVIGVDGSAADGFSSRAAEDSGPSTEVEIQFDVDLVSLDFTEDMYTNSMLGSIFLSNKTGWDAELGSVNGTEWITITFKSQTFTGEGDNKTLVPVENEQRFKVYKVSNTVSEAGTYSTYALAFCSYQLLIDNPKLERHLSDKHIGPIGTEKTGLSEFTNQDYGFVNKIFDHIQADADVSITGTVDTNDGQEQINVPVIDVEETANWINFVPSFLDNRNTENILDRYWRYGNWTVGGNRTEDSRDNRPRKVLDTLNELAENAVAKENVNASNFFVWQDLRGWHFRSVDSYLRDRQGEDDVDRTYSYDITNADVSESREIDRIIDLQVMKQVDFMDLLNVQALSSKIIYYELNPDNQFSSYYMTLPENLLGATRVIGPNGFQDGVGETLVEQQALEESALSYDYLLDYEKWSKVESYPLLQDIEEQYTDYSFPSFLESPPAYAGNGIGNSSWFASAPYDETDMAFRFAHDNRIGTELGFSVTNRAEYFKQKYVNQTTLEGSKFRTVYDKIKTPIINALRDYYNVSLQRLYYEHNLVIDGGLNTLESGEGRLGRGPGGSNEFCDYCLDRADILSKGKSSVKQLLGEFWNNFVDSFDVNIVQYEEVDNRWVAESKKVGYDTTGFENSVINTYLYGLNRTLTGEPLEISDFYLGGNRLNIGFDGRQVGDTDYNFNDFRGSAFNTCTGKGRDGRKYLLGAYTGSFRYGVQTYEEANAYNRNRAEFFLSQPVIEWDNIPRLDETVQGLSYPRCTTPEPLLPYNGNAVDCISVREKWEAIPSECALVREHLGAEYVSPIIRGDRGNPINIDNLTFWNGYWINPKFGLPNLRNYLAFFRDLNADFSGSEASLNAVHESNMFLKDFLPSVSNSISGTEEGLYVPQIFNNWDYDQQYVINDEGYNTSPGIFGETVYEFYTDIQRSVEFGGEQGPATSSGQTRTTTFNVNVNYLKNILFDKLTTCATPFLCGHDTVAGDSVSVPYLRKLKWKSEEADAVNYGGGGFGGGGDPRDGFGGYGGGGIGGGGFGDFGDIEDPEPLYTWTLDDTQISEKQIKFPARWSRGRPYLYGNISSLPQSFVGYGGDYLNNSYTEFLRQFGLVNDDYLSSRDAQSVIINSQNSDTTGGRGQSVADLSGTLRGKGIELAYVPNRALGFYDANRPIYHKKDWQNFLDCNGTCIGSHQNGDENDIDPTKNKAVEYAKLCSYAWNRYWSTPKEQPMYRRAQVALLQSQEVEITVPNDMNLSIGNLIRLNLPKSKSLGGTNQIMEQEKINPIAGKYIVTGIRRQFSGRNTQAMRVRLNRDSLPFDPNGKS